VQRHGSGGPWEEAVGYSRVVRAGDLVFLAGCTAATPEGAVIGGDSMLDQTRAAISAVCAALERVGAGPADVVQTRLSLTDISRWAEAGRAHGEVFGDVRPAAAMVGVSGLIDPRLLVEVEATAFAPLGAHPGD